jgi:hypothetical protein
MTPVSTALPEVQEKKLTLEESAAEFYRLLEENFDSMGLTEAERDERYTRAERRVLSEDAVDAKASA